MFLHGKNKPGRPWCMRTMQLEESVRKEISNQPTKALLGLQF